MDFIFAREYTSGDGLRLTGRYVQEQDLLTTADVARQLSYTEQHTRLLIRRGFLEANKIGRDWLIPRQAIEDFRSRYDPWVRRRPRPDAPS